MSVKSLSFSLFLSFLLCFSSFSVSRCFTLFFVVQLFWCLMHRCRLLACPSVLVVLHFVVHLFSGRLFAVILHCVTFSLFLLCCHSLLLGSFSFLFPFRLSPFFHVLVVIPARVFFKFSSFISFVSSRICCRYNSLFKTSSLSFKMFPKFILQRNMQLVILVKQRKKTKIGSFKDKKEKRISIYNKIQPIELKYKYNKKLRIFSI